MKYVLVVGSPVDGLDFIGPFDTVEEATGFAMEPPTVKATWWVAQLRSTSEEFLTTSRY